MASKKNQKSLATHPDFNSPKEIMSFLQGPTLAIAEVLTGILASDVSRYKLSAGRIVQSAITGKLLSQLGKEINEYKENGKIKENYFATNKNQVTLLELLKFIDTDIPDEEVYKAAKAIFFSSISIDADQAKEELAYQLLLICKKLSSLDILILKTCYQASLTVGSGGQGIESFTDWTAFVSNRIGYDLPELVGARDDHLIELGLLTRRTYADKSGVSKGQNIRLTRLAIKLCEFITIWDNESEKK